MAIAAPTKIVGFSVASKEIHLYWNDGDKIDAKTFVVQQRLFGQGSWNTIQTIQPITTTKGAIPLQRSPIRHYVFNTTQTGNHEFRIRAEFGAEIAISNIITVNNTGNEFYVAPGGVDTVGRGGITNPYATIQYALGQTPANQGHRINFTGDFTFNNPLNWKLGVSLQGSNTSGNQSASIIRYTQNSQYNENQAAIMYNVTGQSSRDNLALGGMLFKNFTIDGGNKQGRAGIILRALEGVTIDGVRINRMFLSGLFLKYSNRYLGVYNSNIINSGYTPPVGSDPWPNEGGNSHMGGIWNKGSLQNVFIYNNNIQHQDGYGLKFSPSYENLSVPGNFDTAFDDFEESIVYNNIGRGGLRSWLGSDAVEFFIEAWNIHTRRVALIDNDSDSTYSLEKKNPFFINDTYSILVADNEMKSIQGGLIEMSNNDIFVDNNILDFRNCTGKVYDVAYDANGKPQSNGAHDVTFQRNLVLFGRFSAPLIGSRNRYTNLKVFNNTLVYDNQVAGELINIIRINGNENVGWEGFQMRNIAILAGSYGRSDFRYMRRAGNNTVTNDGDGIPNNTNSVISHIMVNNAVNALPTGTVCTNHIQQVPQMLGGTNIRTAYRPAVSSNMINAGVVVGLPYAESTADIGYFETNLVGQGVGNIPPTITLTNTSSSIIVGNPVNINYTVNDVDGTIANVKLVVNGVEVQTDSVAPFNSFTLTGLAVGQHNIYVRAEDDDGAVTNSNTITITVRAANVAPICTLTNPLNNGQFPLGGSTMIQATASDTDGTISKVEFYVNNNKVGEKTTAPYEFVYTPPAVGNYAIFAKAFDNDNAETNSNTANINVAVLPESFDWGMNLGGRNAQASAPLLVVDNERYEAFDSNVVKSGIPWDYPTEPVLNPVVTGTKEQMLRTSVSSNAVSPVLLEFDRPTGLYNAYIYVMEDNAPAPFDLFVQGNKVLDNHLINGTGAIGQWQMLGPYPVNNVTGKITIQGNDGAVNIAAVRFTKLGAQVQVSLNQLNNVVAGQNITLTANVSVPPNQSVTKVEFFNGQTKLGEDVSVPYQQVINNIQAGTYLFSARVTDSLNNVINSDPVQVIVAAPNQAPTISFTTPNNINIFAGTSLEIEGVSADDNSVAKIELFNGLTKVAEYLRPINQQTITTWSFIISNLTEGTYTFTARATDSDNISTTSSTLTVVVRRPVVKNRKDRFAFTQSANDFILVRYKKYIGE